MGDVRPYAAPNLGLVSGLLSTTGSEISIVGIQLLRLKPSVTSRSCVEPEKVEPAREKEADRRQGSIRFYDVSQKTDEEERCRSFAIL